MVKAENNLKQVQEMVRRELGVLLYFYNDDCPPCISLRPKVEELLQDRFPKMKLTWVNARSNPEIPAAYGVFANPTILVFFDGKEFRRFSKYVSVTELEDALGRYYGMVF